MCNRRDWKLNYDFIAQCFVSLCVNEMKLWIYSTLFIYPSWPSTNKTLKIIVRIFHFRFCDGNRWNFQLFVVKHFMFFLQLKLSIILKLKILIYFNKDHKINLEN